MWDLLQKGCKDLAPSGDGPKCEWKMAVFCFLLPSHSQGRMDPLEALNLRSQGFGTTQANPSQPGDALLDQDTSATSSA